MRILHLVDRLSVRGGAYRYLWQLVRWQRREHRVLVAYGEKDGDFSITGESTRLPLLGSSQAREEGVESLGALVSEADVCHVHTVMNPVAIRMAVSHGHCLVTVQDHRVFCPGRGKETLAGEVCIEPMSSAICGSCFEDSHYGERIQATTRSRLAALEGAVIHVLSPYMASELERVGLGDIEVIPPWVEAAPTPSSAGQGLLLGGRMVSHKGVMDAWQAWRDSGVDQSLRVAGIGPELARMEGVESLGWLGSDALGERLRQARLLLFPSRWQEPFGILGVEALAQGTPVVVARTGGSGSWSDAGCIEVERGDTQGMAAAITHLCDHPEKARSLGREGWSMVRERFSPIGIQTAMTALYARTGRNSGTIG